MSDMGVFSALNFSQNLHNKFTVITYHTTYEFFFYFKFVLRVIVLDRHYEINSLRFVFAIHTQQYIVD